MAMTRREFLGNSLAVGTMSLASRLDPAKRLSGGVSESDVLAFTHVTVIDATERPALPQQTVLVKGDRIAAIEKFGKLKLPGGAKVIDAKGKYMIPGLWTCTSMHAERPPCFRTMRPGLPSTSRTESPAFAKWEATMSIPCLGGARKLQKASGLALASSPPAPRLRDPSQNCPGRLQLPTLPLLGLPWTN